MNFAKLHGAGNDYVFINAIGLHKDWSALSVEISNRNKGIGSDGLILLLKSNVADIKMTMFNADGSEGKMCGNGIRCLVKFAIDEGVIPQNTNLVTVETLSGILSVKPIFENNLMVKASVKMGSPILNPIDIPVKINSSNFVSNYPLKVNEYNLNLSFVSMGNPHAIAILKEPIEDVPLHIIGPILETNSIFPDRINFEIVNIISENYVKLRVWERGSGLTMACGTGACATVVSLNLQNLVNNSVEVELPGGNLNITWPGNGPVIMEGPVKTVFEGQLFI